MLHIWLQMSKQYGFIQHKHEINHNVIKKISLMADFLLSGSGERYTYTPSHSRRCYMKALQFATVYNQINK